MDTHEHICTGCGKRETCADTGCELDLYAQCGSCVVAAGASVSQAAA